MPMPGYQLQADWSSVETWILFMGDGQLNGLEAVETAEAVAAVAAALAAAFWMKGRIQFIFLIIYRYIWHWILHELKVSDYYYSIAACSCTA
jgi:hypothetical protein